MPLWLREPDIGSEGERGAKTSARTLYYWAKPLYYWAKPLLLGQASILLARPQYSQARPQYSQARPASHSCHIRLCPDGRKP